ncbi:PilW family protein [Myxococcus eversor]|uniref:PilW family protein n=1 Tax=Myxococcus eversor TaxID=2709661 RepID=UPI0013D0FF50|nr:prepilin-type N-terminal cleavage/methylation domain-containing protein [Myxococcus eversor]
MKPLHPPRGFSLIEMMIASTIALVVIAGAVSAGTYLQRRGLLEERTMETQNAGRAARDLFTPAIQRAGEGFGSAPLFLGGSNAEVRYAVWANTNAGPSAGFAQPTGVYVNLRSDVLEIYEADATRALRMIGCAGSGTDSRQGGVGPLCLDTPAPANTDAGIPAGAPLVLADPGVRGACVGVAQATRNVPSPGGNNNLGWIPGAPAASAYSPTSFCTGTGADTSALWIANTDEDPLLLPLSSRIFRVNWISGRPVLEMDPDGALGAQEFQQLSEEIEQLRVRLGVADLDNPAAPLRYFPDTAAVPPRPAVDQCDNAGCWSLIPGDAGTMGASEFGPGSARDELMRRVRVVELLITARSNRPDTQALKLLGDAGTTLDDEGNPQDGYKRRHFLIRVLPRNFGYAGG